MRKVIFSKPSKIIFFFFFFKRPLSRVPDDFQYPNNFFSNYWNSLWYVVVTMTTGEEPNMILKTYIRAIKKIIKSGVYLKCVHD